LATVLAATGFAAPAFADAKWSAFGDAEAVKVGHGDWAINLTSDVASSDSSGYSGIAYSPKKGLTFAGIKNLSVDYVGQLGGGSARFQINVLTDDGVKNIFVYFGTPPDFDDTVTTWTSSGNLIGSDDLRFDLTQIGGPFYGSYADALELAGNLPIVGIQLVVDSGWFFSDGVQTVLVDNIRVNNDKLSSKGFKK